MGKITYYKFKYNDFYENNGLYLRGVWHTPGLVPLDMWFWLPKRYCAFQPRDNEVYISKYTWDKFVADIRENARYDVGTLPKPVSRGETDWDMWKDFVELNPYVSTK